MSAGTAVSKNGEGAREPPWLHVRRKCFEFGLLPLPSLAHNDVVTGLRNLRTKLLQQAPPISTWSLSINSNASYTAPASGVRKRVATAGIAAALEITESHAHLVLDTLASVLNETGGIVDVLATRPVTEIDSVGADVDDLIVFLYVQSYRRVPSRPHRGAADVADVWPSTSAIDGFLPALSPMQVRSSTVSRRLMPGHAEEEVNQLAYMRKHLPNLLSLLAESTEEEETSNKVITAEQFEHLGLLLKAKNESLENMHLCQAAPFFANSDPDMPAAPVPVTQVLEWVQQHLYAASENVRGTQKTTKDELIAKDTSLVESSSSEATTDVPMADATANPVSPTPSTTQTILVPNGVLHLSKDWRPDGMTFVDGVMKASVLKRENDIKGESVKVSHCHDSVVYILAPLKYVSVFGCSDSIIVLGAVGKAVRVEHCERIQLIVPTARITIANCRECVFYLGVNQRPLFTGDNHHLQVAPYNTFYPKLEAHLAQVGVDATVNRWDRILTLGMVDPHDAFLHPAGVTDVQAEGATQLPPEKFVTFSVPRWSEADSEQQLLTRANPFLLPKPYLLAQQHRCKAAENLKQSLKNTPLEEGKKRELISAIHGHFREWLFASGNIRQIYDLQALDRLDSNGME